MRYFLNKLTVLIVTLVLISLAVFFVFQILPGNPALIILGPEADPNQIAALEERLNLNLPPYERYISWVTSAITGDFGDSIRYNMPVLNLISLRLPVTVHLGIMSIIMSVFIGIPVGILIGRYADKRAGRLLSAFAQIGLAVPTFWLGLMLVLVFSIFLAVFPSGGYIPFTQNPIESTRSLLLPALSLSVGNSAIIIRFLKNAISDNLDEDYVRTARSKGRSEKSILLVHVLRNALIPVITIMGMIAAETLSGAIIIENVFSLPGIGQLTVSAIQNRDFPLIQALSLYIAFVVVMINFVVDLIYRLIDPRINLD